MAIREIIKLGNPILRQKARKVPRFDPALRKLVDDPALRARLGGESVAVDAETGIERSVAAFERAVLRAAARS